MYSMNVVVKSTCLHFALRYEYTLPKVGNVLLDEDCTDTSGSLLGLVFASTIVASYSRVDQIIGANTMQIMTIRTTIVLTPSFKYS